MALIPFAEKKLIPPDANDPRIKARMGILHVDAGNASSLYNLFLGNQRAGGSKVESHGFIRKDGHLEQYRDTAFQADANASGNDFAISFETQGYGPGLWTAEQLATIKRVMLWARDVHGIPLRVVTSYNDQQGGWGFHRMFKEWNPNAHSCPGDDRVKQFYDVLVPWMKAQSNTPKEAPVAKTRVTAAREHLANANRELGLALNLLKAMPKSRVKAWAQVSPLWAAILAVRSVIKRLPQS